MITDLVNAFQQSACLKYASITTHMAIRNTDNNTLFIQQYADNRVWVFIFFMNSYFCLVFLRLFSARQFVIAVWMVIISKGFFSLLF